MNKSEIDELTHFVNMVGNEPQLVRSNRNSYSRHAPRSRSSKNRPHHRTPPAHYICHRCNVPGHYIQHCPTNKDAAYDLPNNPRLQQRRKHAMRGVWDATKETGVSDSEFQRRFAPRSLDTMRDSLTSFPDAFKCELCHKLLSDAVVLKCCDASVCNDCVIATPSCHLCNAQVLAWENSIPALFLRKQVTQFLIDARQKYLSRPAPVTRKAEPFWKSHRQEWASDKNQPLSRLRPSNIVTFADDVESVSVECETHSDCEEGDEFGEGIY